MTKPVIYAIVGASGCGKTTATQIMEKYGVQSLVSYTTREMREGETNGKEHWFVSEDDMPPKNRMLAYTLFGGKHYWTTIDQLIGETGFSYIIDEVALVEMIEKFGDTIQIIKVLIKKDSEKIKEIIDEERIKRDSERLILEDNFYDIIITNDSSLLELEHQIKTKIFHI